MMFWAFIFYYFFGVLLYDVLPGPLQYIDEVFPWILLTYGVIRHKGKISKKIVILGSISVFYFFYSIVIKSNSLPAVLFDFAVQIKPFLTYFAVLYLRPRFSSNQRKYIIYSLLSGAVIIFLVGVGRIGKEVDTIQGEILPGARYAFAALYTGISYFFFSDRKKKDAFVSCIILLSGFCAPTSKYFGGICLILMMYILTSKRLRRYRIPLIVAGLLMCLPLIADIVSDIRFYFGDESIARAALYLTAGKILLDYIPFGSGLASFGTSTSANFYSDIYSKYDIDGIYGLSESSIASGASFISDTYVASLAELGIAGIITMLFFFVSAYKKSSSSTFALFFILDIVLENLADSTMIGNRGVFVMIMLAFCAMKRTGAIQKTLRNE